MGLTGLFSGLSSLRPGLNSFLSGLYFFLLFPSLKPALDCLCSGLWSRLSLIGSYLTPGLVPLSLPESFLLGLVLLLAELMFSFGLLISDSIFIL